MLTKERAEEGWPGGIKYESIIQIVLIQYIFNTFSMCKPRRVFKNVFLKIDFS